MEVCARSPWQCYKCDAIAQELADHSWKNRHHYKPYKEDVVEALAIANFPRADVVLDCRVLSWRELA